VDVEHPVVPGAAAPRLPDLTTVAELLAYAGAATALIADGLVVTNSDSLSKGTAAVALGLAAAGLAGAGFLLGRGADDRAARMRSVMWFLSVQAVFELLVVALVLDSGSNPKTMVALSGFLTAGYAGVLWWISKRSLQQIAVFLGAIVALLALLYPDFDFLSGPPDFTPMMLVALLGGAGWFVLGWRGILEPRRTAMVVGSVSALVSSFFLTTSGETTGAAVLVAIVGAALVVAGYVLADRAVSGIGIVGLLIGMSGFVSVVVEGSDGKAIAALVIGLVMVAGAIVLLQPRAGMQPPVVTTGPPGGVGPPAGTGTPPPAPPPAPPPSLGDAEPPAG
jgi:hypothetical protein